MATTQTVLQGKDTAEQGDLYMSLELGDKLWKMSCSDGRHNPSRYSVNAGDTAAVADCICRARARFGLDAQAKVHSCYEAGRDGWWLHRWLIEQGVDNIVVDSASIEVNRRARRAKSDRLDADKLVAMLLRWHGGESRVWSVLRAPTLQEEDARRVDRELQRLTLVKQQMKALQAQQRQEVADHVHPLVRQLSRLRAIGMDSAWKLDKELFGWRQFNNRRQVAASVGLTPTPYDSGGSQVEQGISKAGNKRVRSLLIELAWSWLRYQPDSELSQWYSRRFAAAGKRMRRVGIVALARRLVIALWRYLQHGEIPAGAQLKPAA